VPSGPGRWNRPLCLNVSQDYWVHFTKVTQAGVVSRHRHPAPVHGFVLEGRWRYLERDWVATAGSYLFEPPGDVHTLVVDEGDYMITLFHNTGALLYCDEQGRTVGSTDVFDRVAAARKHFESVGLGSDYVKRPISLSLRRTSLRPRIAKNLSDSSRLETRTMVWRYRMPASCY
jgi:2,4'-dihydroxyacetophenone dioxygenase